VKNLLFVAPALPRPTGSGLQMRAFMFLRDLARERRVTLVAGSTVCPSACNRDRAALDGLVARTVLLDFRPSRNPRLALRRIAGRLGLSSAPSWDWAEPTAAMKTVLRQLHGLDVALVHVSRLYMLPVAMAALAPGSTAPIQLDLDDWESETRLALAALAEKAEPALARRYRREAAALAECERAWLPRLSRVLVCSPSDRDAVARRHGLRDVEVAVNKVEVPPALPAPGTSLPPELLFVGRLGYLPNRDAVRFLVGEVLPRLRSKARLVVAGSGAPVSLRASLLHSDVTLIDGPEDLEPLYARARIALAPIRAGGGTRIKALEAFAHGRPLVATAAAVAGLGLKADEHYLAAETGSEWVAAIEMLLADPALQARLAEAAFAWVAENASMQERRSGS